MVISYFLKLQTVSGKDASFPCVSLLFTETWRLKCWSTKQLRQVATNPTNWVERRWFGFYQRDAVTCTEWSRLIRSFYITQMLRDSVDNVVIWNVTYWEHVTQRDERRDHFCSLLLDIFLNKLHYILYFLQNTRKEKTIFLQILLKSKDTCTLNSEEALDFTSSCLFSKTNKVLLIRKFKTCYLCFE